MRPAVPRDLVEMAYPSPPDELISIAIDFIPSPDKLIALITRYEHMALDVKANHKPSLKAEVTKPTTLPRSRNLRLI